VTVCYTDSRKSCRNITPVALFVVKLPASHQRVIHLIDNLYIIWKKQVGDETDLSVVAETSVAYSTQFLMDISDTCYFSIKVLICSCSMPVTGTK
jgi:hypothetical protein